AGRRKLLELLAEFSFLRTKHFYQLIERDSQAKGTEQSRERGIRRMLKDMTKPFEHGAQYIECVTFNEPSSNGKVHGENIYFPTRKGFDLIEAEGMPESLNLVLHRFKSVSVNRLPHEVELSEIHIY